jgi:ankyrin repeat protein
MDIETDFVMVDSDHASTSGDEGNVTQLQWTVEQAQQWLQPTDYMSPGNEYAKHLQAEVQGTGEWLRNSEHFKTWHDANDKGCLWVKGVPGAGKSVWAAVTAKQLASSEGVPVLFFFFRQIVATNHNPCYLVRDWLSQVLPHSPKLPSMLQQLATNERIVNSVPIEELWNELCCALDSLPRVYCVADALDEMDDEHDQFIHHLLDLSKRQPVSIKVILTSRPIPRIEALLREPTIVSVRLEQNMIQPDVRKYVEARLEILEPRMSAEIQEEVKKAICDRARGLFLHARLMTDNLMEGLKTGVIVEETLPSSLKRLPGNLQELYNSMLEEHARRSGVSSDLQLTILQWATHSFRPLRVLELGSIVSLVQDSVSLKDGKALVRSSCGRLLEILNDESVSVIHHSFTEFLVDATRKESSDMMAPKFPVIDSEVAHRNLAMICLRYLEWCPLPQMSFTDSEDDDSDQSDYYEEREQEREVKFKLQQGLTDLKLKHPLLVYATENWNLHVLKANPKDSDLATALQSYLVPGKPALSTWLRMQWPSRRYEKITAMHVAAYTGLRAYLQRLVNDGAPIDGLDGEKRTPLSYAAEQGHTSVVQFLLDHGADPDSDDRCRLSPLHHAISANRLEVVRLLLTEGVHPTIRKYRDTLKLAKDSDDSISTTGKSPLQFACEKGHLNVISEFIKYLSEDDLCRALDWTVGAEHVEAVSLILETGLVPVNVLVGGTTALFRAAARGNPDLVKLLLEKGAHPNARSEDRGYDGINRKKDVKHNSSTGNGPTPIHALAGFEEPCRHIIYDKDEADHCLRLLLDAGGDIEAKDENGKTALHHACKEMDVFFGWGPVNAVAAILLDHGADPKVVDKRGYSPLHLVSVMGPTLVDLLVKHGADVNAARFDGETPLHSILRRSYSKNDAKEDAFVRLLALGADCSATDRNGNTPLHLIFKDHCQKGARLNALVKAGADLNKRNKQGQMPLHLLGRYPSTKDSDLLRDIVAAGLDLNSRDGQGRTVLFNILQASRLDTESIHMFLELGCSVAGHGPQGLTILHQAIRVNAPLETLRLLVNGGADPQWVDDAGNTLIHEAAKVRPYMGNADFKSYLKALIALGASAIATNYTGQTPLHLVCAKVSQHHNTIRRDEDRMEYFLNGDLGVSYDVDAADCIGARPIHYAATISEYYVGLLLAAGADPTVLTLEHCSPLHSAARARKGDVIALLLSVYRKRGKLEQVINLKDEGGRTALHHACRSGRPESVRLLLEYGANPMINDTRGLTPLHSLSEFPQENALWYTPRDGFDYSSRLDAAGILLSDGLRPHNSQGIPYYRAHDDDDTARTQDILDMLVEAKVDLTARDLRGQTAMDMGLAASCAEMVRGLKNRGSALESKFRETKFPREIAKEAKEMLEKAGGEPEKIVEGFKSILRRRDHALFAEFVDCGANITISTKGGGTALHTLVEWGHASLMSTFSNEAGHLDSIEWLEVNKESETLLVTACQQEFPNLEVLKVLVEKAGVDFNRPSRVQGYFAQGTPLHALAAGAYFWNIDALEYLIKAGADIESRNANGETPLMVAVSADALDGFWKEDSIRVLLKHGANPNAVDTAGQTCLNKSDHPNVTRTLIQAGADVKLGRPPILFSAIKSMDIATIKVLLESGADPNARNQPAAGEIDETIYQYPLHQAALRRRYFPNWADIADTIVRMLLQHGSKPFELYEDGSTILQRIIEDGGILQPFWDLPHLDLEQCGNGGRTLFLSACYASAPSHNLYQIPNNRPDHAMILLNRGASAAAVDDMGYSALHWLCASPGEFDEERQALMLEILTRAGHLVHQRSHEGLKPLHLAIQNIHILAAKELLAGGADPLEADPEGNSALHVLARQLCGEKGRRENAVKCFEFFVELGVPIDARNHLGETPLLTFMATNAFQPSSTEKKVYVYEHMPLFSMFEGAGANIHTRNNAGETLLHKIAQQEHDTEYVNWQQSNDISECFEALMALGVDPFIEDDQERTAIDVAVAAGNERILQLFHDSKAEDA